MFYWNLFKQSNKKQWIKDNKTGVYFSNCLKKTLKCEVHKYSDLWLWYFWIKFCENNRIFQSLRGLISEQPGSWRPRITTDQNKMFQLQITTSHVQSWIETCYKFDFFSPKFQIFFFSNQISLAIDGFWWRSFYLSLFFHSNMFR